MAKTKEIMDITEVFTETIKAVDVAAKEEKDAQQSLTNSEKLEVIQDNKRNATSKEELLKIENLEKELRLEIRLPETTRIEIPADKVALVKHNYQVESDYAAKELDKLYGEAQKMATEFQSKMDPLLKNIETMERKKSHASYIERVLKGEVNNNPELLRYLSRNLVNMDNSAASNQVRNVNTDMTELTHVLVHLSQKGMSK